ncbi:MAG: CHAT domain-containing protein [Aphanothece sp. CMT-3BRIN-NPC111]|nr:CHAT domain-containing protein [Aphanothece sp. CMT-3BRIN-NPC111]
MEAEDSDEANILTQEALSYDKKALAYLREFSEQAGIQKNIQAQTWALINSIEPLYRIQASSLAEEALQQATFLLERLPDSRTKAYAAIKLAKLTTQPVRYSFEVCPSRPEANAAHNLLNRAISIARNIKDSRSESFALGELGYLYECRHDFSQALNLTRQAQWAADMEMASKDSRYLWEWQAGRIFKAQHKELDAIAAYEKSIATIESIRDNILVANRDLQFDFRDSVSPIYRDLIGLKLARALPKKIAEANPAKQLKLDNINPDKELSFIIRILDSLNLAELQNYFGDNCTLNIANQNIADTAVFSNTAIFHNVILKNRSAILVTFPNGDKKAAWIDVNRKTFVQEINEFRRGLENFSDFNYDPTQAQKLYSWIVAPFAKELEQAQVKTLVFIQDGILRSVPMAALHDGKKFLVQKYAFAYTPSLNLTEIKASSKQTTRALAVGISKASIVDGKKFPALINVEAEINQVESEIPGSSKLLNENFTRERLQQKLDKGIYSILHIATHGEFAPKPEDTFLVTGNNSKLTIYELETAIRNFKQTVNRKDNSVELLMLTACQTAVGDDRAALGMAGVAVQAGVKSAIATLWFVQDASTASLTNKFYLHLLNSQVSKAEALHMAQKALIEEGGEYSHPAYWSGFILIGNWL